MDFGVRDEARWSRFVQPSLHAWVEAGDPMRLIEQSASKDDPDPKALAAHGMSVRSKEADGGNPCAGMAEVRGWPTGERRNHTVP